MGGGKSNPQYNENKLRYAPYIETHHQTMLDAVEALTIAAANNNPYDSYDVLTISDMETAFFGAGYVLTDFPTIYDMYGKFMAGLDIDSLYDEILDSTINSSVIDDTIYQEGVRLKDDIELTQLPEFEAGMRDINAVNSSSFVIGKALMGVARTKALAKFSADIRTRLLPVAAERWTRHLEWNKSVVETYAQVLKFFFSARMDLDNHNLLILEKSATWALEMWEYDMKGLGSMQQAINSTSRSSQGGGAGKAIGGALSGASAGAMVGGPFGAAIGGLAGLVGGLF